MAAPEKNFILVFLFLEAWGLLDEYQQLKPSISDTSNLDELDGKEFLKSQSEIFWQQDGSGPSREKSGLEESTPLLPFSQGFSSRNGVGNIPISGIQVNPTINGFPFGILGGGSYHNGYNPYPYTYPPPTPYQNSPRDQNFAITDPGMYWHDVSNAFANLPPPVYQNSPWYPGTQIIINSPTTQNSPSDWSYYQHYFPPAIMFGGGNWPTNAPGHPSGPNGLHYAVRPSGGSIMITPQNPPNQYPHGQIVTIILPDMNHHFGPNGWNNNVPPNNFQQNAPSHIPIVIYLNNAPSPNFPAIPIRPSQISINLAPNWGPPTQMPFYSPLAPGPYQPYYPPVVNYPNAPPQGYPKPQHQQPIYPAGYPNIPSYPQGGTYPGYPQGSINSQYHYPQQLSYSQQSPTYFGNGRQGAFAQFSTPNMYNSLSGFSGQPTHGNCFFCKVT